MASNYRRNKIIELEKLLDFMTRVPIGNFKRAVSGNIWEAGVRLQIESNKIR